MKLTYSRPTCDIEKVLLHFKTSLYLTCSLCGVYAKGICCHAVREETKTQHKCAH